MIINKLYCIKKNKTFANITVKIHSLIFFVTKILLPTLYYQNHSIKNIIILMKQYYLHNGIAESGPYSLEELKQMTVTPTTKIRYENTEYWFPVSQLETLGLKTNQDKTLQWENDKDWKDMSNNEKIFNIAIVLIGWSLIIGAFVYVYFNWSYISSYLGVLGKKYAIIQLIYDPKRSAWSNIIRVFITIRIVAYLLGIEIKS